VGRKGGGRRGLVAVSAAALLATLALAAVYHRPIISHVVTRLALSDARAMLPVDPESTHQVGALGARYEIFFRQGYLDRAHILAEAPASGLTPEAAPEVMVIAAYFEAAKARLLPVETSPEALEEFRLWLDPLVSSKSKEVLVNLLTEDYTLSKSDQSGGPLKKDLINFLLARRSGHRAGLTPTEPWQENLLKGVSDSHWQAILRDCRHPEEKVRAGALLMLCQHPSEALIRQKAREALLDPSHLVRLAGAGILGFHGERGGVLDLLLGLWHPRWEIRWWSGMALAFAGPHWVRELVALRASVEQDSWVKGELSNAANEFSKGQLTSPRVP
jgi:hypothetical protein